VVGLSVTSSFAANEERMPSARFAAILGRLLTYDSSLQSRAGRDIGIAVLYRRGNAQSLAEANEVFDQIRALEGGKTLELPVKTYKLAVDGEADLEKAATAYGLTVFVVTGGMVDQTDIVRRISARRKILTVGNDGIQARRGLSVAIYVSDGKSKILVNLGASKREGTAFDSALLGMCEIIP
jgi:hypothetical protein